MGQVDAEAGMTGPPAATGYAGQPANGFTGVPVWTQEPTADFSSDDLVSVYRSDRTATTDTIITTFLTIIGAF